MNSFTSALVKNFSLCKELRIINLAPDVELLKPIKFENSSSFSFSLLVSLILISFVSSKLSSLFIKENFLFPFETSLII